MKNRAGFWLFFIFLSLLIFFGLAFKDKLALCWVSKRFADAMPASTFSAQRFVVWPGYIEAKNFEFKKRPGFLQGLDGKGKFAVIKFSTLGLLKNPLLAIREVFASVDNLRYGGIILDNIAVEPSKAKGEKYPGLSFTLETLKYNQIAAKNIKGYVEFRGDSLNFDHIDATTMGGTVTTSGFIELKKGAQVITFKVHLDHVELRDLIKAFQAQKRVDASGTFSGDMVFVMKNGSLALLKGGLTSAEGGNLIITDTSLLDRNLVNTKGANIVVENLENYHYDIGNVKLENEGRDIRMDILLEGRSGIRHLVVVWHRVEDKKD